MPVLVTIATVNLLFGGSNKVSLLNPALLREKLEKLDEGDSRTKSLALVDKIETLAETYDQAKKEAIKAYMTDVSRYSTTEEELTDDFAPLDQTRKKMYHEFIAIRQELINALSVEEWDNVFS